MSPWEFIPAMPEDAVPAEPGPGMEYDLVSLQDGSVSHIVRAHLLVGCREDCCDFVIPQDPKNHKVSREHAVLLMKGGKLFAKDISSNGTFLRSAESEPFRLPKDTEVEVRDRQILRFADREYQIRYTDTE